MKVKNGIRVHAVDIKLWMRLEDMIYVHIVNGKMMVLRRLI